MIDKHHPFNTEKHWTATKESKLLRVMYLYPMDRQVHEELHRECPPVPLLGYYALRSILSDVNPIKEPRHDLEEVMFAIEKSTRHPKAHPIEKQLGMLTIEALQLQLPYIVSDTATIIDLQNRKGA